MPRKTPLFDRHVQLGGRVVDFHGWQLPVQYSGGIIAEHDHCRSAACLFDTCHMGQLEISSPQAGEALGTILTQDAAALPVGRCQYGFILDENGGIIDDTILMRLEASRFLLVVNAATRDGDAEWLRERLGQSAHLRDLSEQWGKLDLQGPASFQVLGDLIEADLTALGYFSVVQARCGGVECVVSRTGYTGELGYELFLPASAVAHVFQRLLEEAVVHPAGLGARDLLRLEMSYPLYGQDISRETNPVEADMERFVDLDRDFLGAEALRKLRAAGPKRKLVAFRGLGRRRADHGLAILAGDDPVGTVTSAAYSPSLGVSIGLGYVRADLAKPNVDLTVRHSRGDLPIRVAPKPLYQEGTCRKRDFAKETHA